MSLTERNITQREWNKEEEVGIDLFKKTMTGNDTNDLVPMRVLNPKSFARHTENDYSSDEDFVIAI